MDSRAAKGIAANIRIIAKSTAEVALIDSDATTCWPDKYRARANAVEAIDKAENSIAEWLMQPMTHR